MSRYMDSSNPRPLKDLLSWVHTGQVALPDFQRDLVWKPPMTVALLASLARDHPAGSLIALQSGGTDFRMRAVMGAPEVQDRPNYLLLDGQQRLTTLYQALYGAGDYLYFADLGRLEETGDIDEDGVMLFVRRNAQRGRDRKERDALATLEGQKERLVLPLAELFGGKGLDGWVTAVSRLCAERDEEQALADRLKAIVGEWFDPILGYQFPWVLLKQETPEVAICTIFEDLNRRGVRLSVFDLLVARFYTHDVFLRDLWEETSDDHRDQIGRFGVEPYYLLECISLLATYERSLTDERRAGAPTASCKRGSVLELNAEAVARWWKKVSDAMAETIRRLGEDCGVHVSKWLPYEPMLVPYAASLAWYREKNGDWPKGAERGRLARWFWCSVFGQTYEQGASAQSGKDFVELNRWLAGGDEPTSVAECNVDGLDLTRIGPRQQALYKATMAMVLSGRPRDFRNNAEITRSQLEGEVDDHHVFPKGYLPDTVSDERRNCVPNRVLIDAETNRSIGKKAPSVYLSEIRDGSGGRTPLGEATLTTILESHLLPASTDGPLWGDAFDEFVAARAGLLMEQIKTRVGA